MALARGNLLWTGRTCACGASKWGYAAECKSCNNVRRDITSDPVARFWEKVNKTDGCWLWMGSKTRGYGGLRTKAGVSLAHRFAYELLVGPIPDGLPLDHLCRVPACVNPAHLEPVTPAENVRRARPYRTYELQSHCKRGHPLAGDNITVNLNAQGRTIRHCRTCEHERYLRRRCA